MMFKTIPMMINESFFFLMKGYFSSYF